jgi:hexosaminidase
MYKRLARVSQLLEGYGITFSANSDRMLQRLAGDADPAALRVLSSVVEPPKEYDREGLRDYDLYTPLNRMVDAVPPESNQAREFRDIAKRISEGKAAAGDLETARRWLILWRDNDGALQPLLPKSALTIELIPVSHNLSAAARIGLSALDELEQHHAASAAEQKERLATLKSFEAPQAALLDVIVPAIETLVMATHP